ncbi:MAG TPA: DegV family protein [Solirubrobacteraceae bacterium]|jgi:DegV family protein with EDD domain|nr:DegV family protein [Solirubrobacteraceae bacterium]
MGGVSIVTDTTHYMPPELLAANGIGQVSLYVNWGDDPQREGDMENFDSFYDRLLAGTEMPTTSQPSVGDFLEVYEPLLEQGQDILSVQMSGGISGTYSTALQAKQVCEERGAGGRIEVMDSESSAGGLAAVVLAAAAAARGGRDLAGTLARAREAREATQIWFAVDTLEYLQRGGRIGRAQAWLGGALKVKPILTLGAEITPVERVRTSGRAYQRMVEFMESLHRDGSDGWMVQHIRAPEQAERLVAHGRELFGSEPVLVSELGPVLGTYTGPGMLGVGGLPARLLEP